MVEDSKADVYLIREAIDLAKVDADLHVVPDGHRAIQYLQAANDNLGEGCPDLVLLDLNLPRKNGVDVLSALRASAYCGHTQVLVVTSSDSIRDRNAVAPLGVAGYFKKPSDYDAFLKLGPLVASLLAGLASGSPAP